MSNYKKKLFTIFLTAVAMAVSCQHEDIWDKLNDHEQRIAQLEKQCRELNSNIGAIQVILTAIQQNDYVTEVMKIMENGIEVGYSITFAKGGTVNIYHGSDGADVSAPKVSIRKAQDGEYYWTADGEWMTDENGEKIPAVVADDPDGEYVTPQFRVAEGKWYISYDSGNSWMEINKTGGSQIFKEVTYDEDYVYLTLADGTTLTIQMNKNDSPDANIAYISPTGSDSNTGLTPDSPIKSFAKAKTVLSHEGELVFLDGLYENFDLDLSYFAGLSTLGQNAILIYPKSKISAPSLVSGYSKIYSAPHKGTLSGFVWQHGVYDSATEISPYEIHPLHRNRTHRLVNTRIYNVADFDKTSTDLAGFLNSIENDDRYMYYVDTSTSTLYFSAPNPDFESYPVIVPSSKKISGSIDRTVNISGLNIMYASFAAAGLSGTINNISVGYTNAAGCIISDNTFDLTFNNCEVAAGKNDGINGHKSGDITCFNCWGHDCSDDGESSHETCHIVQYGGLYEYNGNGCTPASGASGEYYNVWARNNGDYPWVTDKSSTGFSAQGASALILCNGCLSIGHKIGFRVTGTGSNGTFINCTSTSDNIAFSNGVTYNCTIE